MYGVHSRDYLARAKARLAEGSPEALFYAAYEVRCGIEARMRQYLAAQAHVSKSLKKGWQVAKLARNLDKVFKSGSRIVRFAVHDAATGELRAEYLYTPVMPRLKDIGQRFGNYLHASTKLRRPDDTWWSDFRTLLEVGCGLLEDANFGTLLGPPLWNPKTGQGHITVEALDGQDPALIANALGMPGESVHVNVAYHDSLADARGDAP